MFEEDAEEDEEELLFGEKPPEKKFEEELAERKTEEGELSGEELHRRGKECQMERNFQSAAIYF